MGADSGPVPNRPSIYFIVFYLPEYLHKELLGLAIWIANLQTLTGDPFPGYQIGAVSGLSGTGGALANFIGNLVHEICSPEILVPAGICYSWPDASSSGLVTQAHPGKNSQKFNCSWTEGYICMQNLQRQLVFGIRKVLEIVLPQARAFKFCPRRYLNGRAFMARRR
ncbi:MAG: hypothetical protein ACR2IV_19035 [Bryobacteraceae bacterium]